MQICRKKLKQRQMLVSLEEFHVFFQINFSFRRPYLKENEIQMIFAFERFYGLYLLLSLTIFIVHEDSLSLSRSVRVKKNKIEKTRFFSFVH